MTEIPFAFCITPDEMSSFGPDAVIARHVQSLRSNQPTWQVDEDSVHEDSVDADGNHVFFGSAWEER